MGLQDGDIIETQVRGRCFGQRIILTEHFRVLGSFPEGNSVATDLKQISTDFLAGEARAFIPVYLAALPPQYIAEEVRAQRIWPERAAYQSTVLTDLVGTNANAATVANDAAAVTMRTQLSGRRFLGTKKIGPVPDAVSSAGLIIDAYILLLAAIATKMQGSWVPPASGSLLQPVIWHRDIFTFTEIRGFAIGKSSRVNRRRTVGIGE